MHKSASVVQPIAACASAGDEGVSSAAGESRCVAAGLQRKHHRLFPRVLEVLGQISAGDLTRYPEREPVERIVAEHLGTRAGEVVLTNGVDEAIHVLFETFLESGDELLLPVPTYTMYEVYASATDAQCRRGAGGRTICSFLSIAF